MQVTWGPEAMFPSPYLFVWDEDPAPPPCVPIAVSPVLCLRDPFPPLQAGSPFQSPRQSAEPGTHGLPTEQTALLRM